MAISDELKAQILRYHFVEHWRVGTIASQLGVHHYTVERVLSEAGVERERQRQRRASKLDPYLALITETLERFPTLTAARLFDMVKARGYLNYDNRYADLLFEVVTRRYLTVPVLITTNKPFSEWADVFSSAACVVTLVDRLIHRSEIVQLDGESYRLREAKEQAAKRSKARSRRTAKSRAS